MSELTFEVTSANFQEKVLKSELPVLVEFGAEWCPPCKMLKPVIDDLARRYAGKMQVGLLDCDAEPDIQQKYGIMGLPTLLLFQNGTPVQFMVGYMPRERIEAKLLPHLQTADSAR